MKNFQYFSTSINWYVPQQVSSRQIFFISGSNGYMLPLNVIHILTNGFGFNKLDIIMNTYGTNNFGGENLHASFSDFIIGDKVSHLKFKKFKVHHILVKIHFSKHKVVHMHFT